MNHCELICCPQVVASENQTALHKCWQCADPFDRTATIKVLLHAETRGLLACLVPAFQSQGNAHRPGVPFCNPLIQKAVFFLKCRNKALSGKVEHPIESTNFLHRDNFFSHHFPAYRAMDYLHHSRQKAAGSHQTRNIFQGSDCSLAKSNLLT